MRVRLLRPLLLEEETMCDEPVFAPTGRGGRSRERVPGAEAPRISGRLVVRAEARTYLRDRWLEAQNARRIPLGMTMI